MDGEREILVEKVVPGRRLGRHVDHHPLNRQFAARALMAAPVRRTRVWWRPSTPFDQGEESSCTWQATAGLVITSPHRLHRKPAVRDVVLDPRYRYEAYRETQRNDDWPGEEPAYYGTSVGSAMKLAKARGLIDEYRWCFGLDDTLDWLSSSGPVVIGVSWYSVFDSIGPGGRFPEPGEEWGSLRGGHAMEVRGIRMSDRTVSGVNSWGTGWGHAGHFRMSFKTLDVLLRDRGESVGAVKL